MFRETEESHDEMGPAKSSELEIGAYERSRAEASVSVAGFGPTDASQRGPEQRWIDRLAERGRGLDILHVDLDCFFAAVEVRERPELRGLPVVVGGTSARGVVASCNYEARAYGVRSAMPSFEARRLCPRAVFLEGRHGLYRSVSRQFLAVLESFSPILEPVGLDEAYLDVRHAHHLFGSSAALAARLREEVHDELGLVCSVGIGATKLIAKLASRAAKPTIGPDRSIEAGRGVFAVSLGEQQRFLEALEVRRLPGVGPRTAERLCRYGVATVGDLALMRAESLERLLGRAAGSRLFSLAHGQDPSPVDPRREAKSLGREETFPVDLAPGEILSAKLLELCDSVVGQLGSLGLSASTIEVKIRTPSFACATRSRQLDEPVEDLRTVRLVASDLLASLEERAPFRLLGVSVRGLGPKDRSVTPRVEQLSFVDLAPSHPQPSHPQRSHLQPGADVDAVVAAIRRRYGPASVGPAVLLDRANDAARRVFRAPHARGGPTSADAPRCGDPLGNGDQDVTL